ncbi:hypothetical protein OC845_004996 [Tilletia horrida]|nr:hypothetical protein OC845_004996 [Tilletia horrida]
MDEQWNEQQQASSSSSSSSTLTPTRSKASKRSHPSTAAAAVAAAAAASDSAISLATFLLPPFSAPQHPTAATASESVHPQQHHQQQQQVPSAMTASTSLRPGISSTPLTHLHRQLIPPSPISSASQPPQHSPSNSESTTGPPTAPQYRTSAATAQRKLVAAQRARLSHLSRNLTTRLQYASFKVEHGWVQQSLSEVENLYYRTVLAARIRDRQRQALEEARRRMAASGSAIAVGTDSSTTATSATLAELTPNATSAALGKRKARDSIDAGVPIDLSPTQRPPSSSPIHSLSAQTSPAATATPVNGTPARSAAYHRDNAATGSPPSKRVRYNSAHELALGADLLGLGASGLASLVGPVSAYSTSPGKSTGPTLKIGNPSLGGHKQDLFTAHGLVTPASFLSSALFSKGSGSQAQQQQQQSSQSHGSQSRLNTGSSGAGASTQAGQRGLVSSVQLNGHGPSPQRPQPTPPLTEPGSTPPGRPPQKQTKQQSKQLPNPQLVVGTQVCVWPPPSGISM